MKTIDKTKPVMITGATGYLAGRIVETLLDEGLTVHAPVRQPDNQEKLKYLNAIAEKAPGSIQYFKADLLDEGSYDEAMRGCELVYHTASPFINSVKDPQKELVDPALKGTRNVLGSVNRTESVKRVVLTSSCAAIVGDTIDLLELPNGTATEETWNTTSTLKHVPYSYSKTVAEREAWKICETQDRWDLVVINPTFILGPGISPVSTSESFNIMKQLGDGTMKMGAPGFEIGVVDVRDVATAQFKAGFTPEAKGRHIITAESKNVLQMAEILRNHFGDAYPFPKRELPKFMVWLVAPTIGMERKMVWRNFGYPWKVDNSKSKRELGMTYNPPEAFIIDFFQQLVDNNIFDKN